MTFSPLELILATGFVSTVVGVAVKVICDGQCVKLRDCEKHRQECAGDLDVKVRWLVIMVRLLCEKEGISVEKQEELRLRKDL